jgi:rRNA-processing protein FCF1
MTTIKNSLANKGVKAVPMTLVQIKRAVTQAVVDTLNKHMPPFKGSKKDIAKLEKAYVKHYTKLANALAKMDDQPEATSF